MVLFYVTWNFFSECDIHLSHRWMRHLPRPPKGTTPFRIQRNKSKYLDTMILSPQHMRLFDSLGKWKIVYAPCAHFRWPNELLHYKSDRCGISMGTYWICAPRTLYGSMHITLWLCFIYSTSRINIIESSYFTFYLCFGRTIF